MRNTHLTVRLAPSLLARLDELAEQRGLSRSAVVREAVLALTWPDRPPIADRQELLRLASDEARMRGSVAAARLLLEELRREGGDQKPMSAIDELAHWKGRG